MQAAALQHRAITGWRATGRRTTSVPACTSLAACRSWLHPRSKRGTLRVRAQEYYYEVPDPSEDAYAENPWDGALNEARDMLKVDSKDVDVNVLADRLDTLEQIFNEMKEQLWAARREAAPANEQVAAAEARAVAAEAEAEEAAAKAKDQYVRLQADFENFRRRTAQEKIDLATKATGDVVASLLPLVDNFELARTQVKVENEGEERINNSYQSLYKQMVDIVRGLGVEPVETVGQPFDPEFHDAIMREANDDVPDGTVLQEFRKGFALKGKLLRPAMVKVSFTDAPSDVSAAVTQEEAEVGAE